MQSLRDIAGVLQSMMLGGTLPDTMRRFMLEPMPPHELSPDVGANSYQEATPNSHSRSSSYQEGRPRSPPPRKNPHPIPKRNENLRMENRARSPQRLRYHETVASTPKRQDNQTAASIRDNMKRVVEEVLERRKLIPIVKEH